MRRVASFLLAAGLVVGVALPAHAAPTSSDPKTAARDAAAWLASQVNADGFIPLATDAKKPDLSTTAQAVPALASAGVGNTKVQAILAYLGKHVNDLVVTGGVVAPGALAYLILAAKAGGLDPTSFGTPPTNLVQRLIATRQPSGLFGSADATFDGAFRQGLSLLALAAAGRSDAAAVKWLEDQECANGFWVPIRDLKDACPPPNPQDFTGPDTNGTALAVLGLSAQGRATRAHKGANALKTVRTSDGGWGFLALSSQATDADSTGFVLEALRTVNRASDTRGVTALLALQVGCTADPSDRGGIAFQPGAGGTLAPNALATAQSIAGLAEVALPVTNATITDSVPVPCEASPPVTGQGTTSTSTSPSTTVAAATAAELPKTGSSSGPLVLVALGAGAAGAALVGGARRKRRT